MLLNSSDGRVLLSAAAAAAARVFVTACPRRARVRPVLVALEQSSNNRSLVFLFSGQQVWKPTQIFVFLAANKKTYSRFTLQLHSGAARVEFMLVGTSAA